MKGEKEMYKVEYKKKNLYTGEVVWIEETFDRHSDAKTFLDQAKYPLMETDWENSCFHIAHIA